VAEETPRALKEHRISPANSSSLAYPRRNIPSDFHEKGAERRSQDADTKAFSLGIETAKCKLSVTVLGRSSKSADENSLAAQLICAREI